MKKIYKFLGVVFTGFSFLFIPIHLFIRTSSAGETFSRDILGLAVPTPPLWLSYIPFLGSVIGFVWEFFSAHGAVGILIFLASFSLGSYLIDASKLKNQEIGKNNHYQSTQLESMHVNIKEYYPLKTRAKRFFHKLLP